MSSHKGYTLLRDTVMALQPRNLEFLIVDHSKSPDWSKRATWGNVPVTFIGRQPQKDIAKLYGRIDVLMAPSIWPESFGLVTREAAQCGCWVVASNIGGIGEDVEHEVNGFVISPDETALGGVIEQIDRECPELCVSGPAHAVSDTQASKRSPNIMANWLRAANHSRTFLPSFSNLRIAR